MFGWTNAFYLNLFLPSFPLSFLFSFKSIYVPISKVRKINAILKRKAEKLSLSKMQIWKFVFPLPDYFLKPDFQETHSKLTCSGSSSSAFLSKFISCENMEGWSPPTLLPRPEPFPNKLYYCVHSPENGSLTFYLAIPCFIEASKAHTSFPVHFSTSRRYCKCCLWQLISFAM